ncbi:hypothetical protein C8R45DRAFT_908089 [Mycena sanguinolenta]|nr:hypothetical protein C8R45DRAFT_908089 [Mycena sanguinolenta]
MPVSFSVAAHPATPFPFAYPNTANEIFAAACKDQSTKADEILQFSLPGADGSGRNMSAKMPGIVPKKNGFVATLLDAYTQDRALVIRPDDVWLAILCQFNFFVNGRGRGELLRANFVAHAGKRELVVDVRPATRHTADFGQVSRIMADLVEKNVVDPTLRAWATPNFTTTTLHDTTVSAVILMATLKQYFSYKILAGGCGIPRVTLDGEKSDWEDILGRLEKLKEYGLETTAWYHLLRPVITRFVGAFDEPTSPENVDFWQRVAHYTPGGSGFGNHYTGWMTAFTAFDKDGRWIGNQLNNLKNTAPESDPATLTSEQFWVAYGGSSINKDLVLDGTPYHLLYRGSIPPAYAEVDVLLIDDNVRFDCAMVGGSVGMRVTSSGDRTLSPEGTNDTVQPVLGWWLFVKDEDSMMDKAEKLRRQMRYGGMGDDDL